MNLENDQIDSRGVPGKLPHIRSRMTSAFGPLKSRSGMGLTEVIIATGIMGIVALGTVQMFVNMNKQNRSIRQSTEAGGLQSAINQLLSNQDVCSLNFGTTSTNPIRLDIPPAATVLNRNLIDRNSTVIYVIDGATPYADGTLVIDSYTLTQTAVLQDTPPASVVGKMNVVFSKTGDTTGSVKLVRTINFQAKLAAGLDSPVDTCSAIGADDILWMRNGDHILNTNPGNVGIGTSNPSNKLEVRGGNIIVSNSGSDAFMGATSTAPNEIVGLGWSAAGFGYVQSGTWGGATRNLVLQGGGGNVGIGAINPARQLHIQGNGAAADTGLTIENTGPTSALASILELKSAARTYHLGIGGSGRTDGLQNKLYMYDTSVGPRFVLDTAGNFGFGTINPTVKLDVAGASNFSVQQGQIRLSDLSGSGMALNVGSGYDSAMNKLGWIQATESSVSNGRNLSLQPYGGNVGIGTTAPGSTLQVGGTFAVSHGASSVRFADEGGASVMRLKSNNGGGVAAMIVGNGGVDYQVRVNSDNSFSLGHYPNAGDFRGFTIRGNATVNGGNYTGTVFEFGQSSGSSTARIIGSPSGSVFQGLTGVPTLYGNWDGGPVEMYSSNRTVVTGGGGGVRVGSFGGEVELLASNAIRFNSANGQIIGNAAYNQNSDERLKKNILPLEDALEKVLDLRGVSYDWKNPEHAKNGRQVGLIAQEVERVYPEIVVTDRSTGLKAVAYDHLVAPLIEAVKALFEMITRHSAEIESLREENEVLKTRIQALEANQSRINERLQALEAASVSIREPASQNRSH